jgi:putative intracellular protease/amidase
MLAQVVLFDGFDPLDVIGPCETLTAAGVRAELVTAEGPREVPAGMNPLSLRATARPSRQRPSAIATPGTAAAPTGGQDRRIARSPRPPRGSCPVPAYRAGP